MKENKAKYVSEPEVTNQKVKEEKETDVPEKQKKKGRKKETTSCR